MNVYDEIGRVIVKDPRHPGPLIEEARKKKGITKTDLANRAGIARTTMYYICSGERDPSAMTFLRIAEILEVPIFELY